MDNPFILHFVSVTVFSLMLAMGVNHSLHDLTSLFRKPALLLRSLLAVIVLVPGIVLLLVSTLGLSAGRGHRIGRAGGGTGRSYVVQENPDGRSGIRATPPAFS